MAEKEKRAFPPRAIERGLAIRKRRTEMGLSQQKVAATLGLSRERISQIEGGEANELERPQRLGLCKLMGFEESELLLDPEGALQEFDMPLSREAKSVAYQFDDLPEQARSQIKKFIATTQDALRNSPDLAKQMYPDLKDKKSRPKPKKT